jgi:hypothetical protein
VTTRAKQVLALFFENLMISRADQEL